MSTDGMVAEPVPVLTRQRKWQLKMASLNLTALLPGFFQDRA